MQTPLGLSSLCSGARRAIVLGSLAWAASTMVGCAGHARLESVEKRRAASPIVYDDYKRLGYALDWVGYPALSPGQHVTFIRPYDDAVLVLESGSRVSALDGTSGALRWSFELANPLALFVGLDRDGDRVICSRDSEVYVLSLATGNPLLRQTLSKVVSTAPVLFPDVAVYGTPTGEIFAHLFVQGVKMWANALPEAIRVKPLLIGSIIGVVSDGGSVIFLDAGSGSSVGRNRIADGADVDPIQSGDLMIVASRDQSIYAFDSLNGGALTWRFRTARPLTDQPVVHNGVVYITISLEDKVGLAAIRIGQHEPEWINADVHGRVVGIRNGLLVVWGDGALSLVDPSRGATVEHVELPTLQTVVTSRFEDGNLFTVSKKGVVARFVPRR